MTQSKKMIAFAIVMFGVLIQSAQGATPKLPESFLPVPLIRQATEYSCGAAALLSVLYYWNAYSEGEVALHPHLGTNSKNGTSISKIVDFAREKGLRASWKDGLTLRELGQAIQDGKTVILNIQAWPGKKSGSAMDWENTWEFGHFVTLVAIDSSNVYVMDPEIVGSYGYIPRDEFVSRWHDYEERNGKVSENNQLGIFISGKKPMDTFPMDLKKVE